MKISLILLCAAGLLAACRASKPSDEPGASTPGQKPADTLRLRGRLNDTYRKLLNANEYAIGGIGVAGTISLTERWFDTLMAQPDNQEIMLSLVAKATPAGQMYGLLGLHRLHYQNEAELMTKYASRQDSATTVSGCMMMIEPVSTVAMRIQKSR